MNNPNNESLLESCLSGTLDTEFLELAKTGKTPEAERIREVIRFAALVDEARLEAPPRSVHKAALAAGKPAVISTKIKTWVASLFTAPGELRPAFRGTANAPSMYHAGPFELDVLRTETGALIGELAPTNDSTPLPSRGLACLFGPAGVRTVGLIDGEFRIESVEPGTYRLVLDLESNEDNTESIVIPDLEL